MMKIQQTRHGNLVFLQVFAYQYHKDLRATNKPIFNGPKKLLWPSFFGHDQGNKHVLGGGLVVC